jgi:hypothetical protein
VNSESLIFFLPSPSFFFLPPSPYLFFPIPQLPPKPALNSPQLPCIHCDHHMQRMNEWIWIMGPPLAHYWNPPIPSLHVIITMQLVSLSASQAQHIGLLLLDHDSEGASWYIHTHIPITIFPIVGTLTWHCHIGTVFHEQWSHVSTISLFWWFATCTSFGILTWVRKHSPIQHLSNGLLMVSVVSYLSFAILSNVDKLVFKKTVMMPMGPEYRVDFKIL